MAHITAANVRAAGGFTSLVAPDATLEAIPFIPFGDVWLDSVLENNSTTYASLSASDQTRVQAAESFYVASLFAKRMPEDDFKSAIVESKGIKAQDKLSISKGFYDTAVKILDEMGYSLLSNKIVIAGGCGGSDYSSNDSDNTQVDFSEVSEDYPYNFFGI